jgi:hypothetical protein
MPNKESGAIAGMLMAGVLAGLLICTGCQPAHPSDTSLIKIGSPDGAGGLLAAYAVSRMDTAARTVPLIENEPIQDCCSSYAQWALSSGSVDAAIVCIDAADSLVEKDDRYSIIGPCLANSDQLIVKDPAKVQTVGIAQNHQYREDLVRKVLGPQCRVKLLLATALTYAYTGGSVDGVVIDVAEAFRLSGVRLDTRRDSGDLVTYVLVASKNFRESSAFDPFITVFREAAAELNDPAKLQQAMLSYSRHSFEEKEADRWIQTGIRFMAPQQGKIKSGKTREKAGGRAQTYSRNSRGFSVSWCCWGSGNWRPGILTIP